MRTTTIRVTGETNMKSLCGKLIRASQWFGVLPLPDDRWEIAVKEENYNLIQGWSDKLNTENQPPI